MNETATLEIGSEAADGYSIEIVNGFNDGSDEYTSRYVQYVLHGVEDVRIEDPYNTGLSPNSIVHVDFSNGGTEHFHGVITEIYNTEA